MQTTVSPSRWTRSMPASGGSAASSAPPQSSTRNDFIDYLRGCLILLVAYGHLLQHLAYNDQGPFYEDWVFKAIYTFHMPMFMAVSGFVSFHAIRGRPFSFTLQRRVQQLIVPALCWAVLYTLAKALPAVFGKPTASAALHGFVRGLAQFKPGFWFLYAVVFCTVVVAALRALDRDQVQYLAGASLLLLFVPDVAKIHYMQYLLPFFCVGYALARGEQIRLPASLSAVAIAGVFLLAAGCYWLWTPDTYIYTTGMKLSGGNLPNVLLRYAGGVVFSAAFLQMAAWVYRRVKSPMLSRYGKQSLDIYIIHGFIAEALMSLSCLHSGALWFRLLALPLLAWLLCEASYRGGQLLERIPLAGRVLLGRPAAPPTTGRAIGCPRELTTK